MRCTCCNRILNPYESTRRHAVTREFLDICNKCFTRLGIPSTEREDLRPEEEVIEDLEDVDGEDDWDHNVS